MHTDPPRLAREEAHHRFLNTLTTLHLLLRRDFDAFEDPRVRDAVMTFEAQLLAFAGIQRSLQASPVSGILDVPVHFGRLCAQLAGVLLAPRGVACEFIADEGELDAVTGEKLGLILVELVTNAAKHAFCGRGWGRVSINLRRDHSAWRCAVQDNGAGLGVSEAGTGLRLIEGLARGMGAGLNTFSDESGVTVILTFPAHPSQGRDPHRPGPGPHRAMSVETNGARLRAQ